MQLFRKFEFSMENHFSRIANVKYKIILNRIFRNLVPIQHVEISIPEFSMIFRLKVVFGFVSWKVFKKINFQIEYFKTLNPGL